MRKVYFDLDNGSVVRPRMILPSTYCVEINWRLKINKMYCCFSNSNIETYGEKWRDDSLIKERDEWESFKWLNTSLKKYIRKNLANILFRKRFNEVINEHYTYFEI
jgi:hypothetical protein